VEKLCKSCGKFESAFVVEAAVEPATGQFYRGRIRD
jgi:hypothetical protein